MTSAAVWRVLELELGIIRCHNRFGVSERLLVECSARVAEYSMHVNFEPHVYMFTEAGVLIILDLPELLHKVIKHISPNV